MHGGERKQSVLDAVTRENHERTLTRETAIEKPLRQRADPAVRLTVRDMHPFPLRPASREKREVRSAVSPLDQAFGERAGIGAEPVRRSRAERAIRTRLDDYVRRQDPRRGCMRHGSTTLAGPE